jgi:hypothetical protein
MRSALARWVDDPGLVALHLVKGLLKFTETSMGAVATWLSPARGARELRRLEQNRPRDGERWFTREESALVEILASLVVPSDETGPGADQMGRMGPSAAETLDHLVRRSSRRQTLYARGLLALDRLARQQHRSRFVELSRDDQLRLLHFIDRLQLTWSSPRSLRDKIGSKIAILYRKWSGVYAAAELFPFLVQDVLQAFYSNRVSWTWLGYDGPPMPEGYPLLQRRSQVSEAEMRS